MNERSYVGIDMTDQNEWVVVLWRDGKTLFSRTYGNTVHELAALTRFIAERCHKPRICLNLAHANVFELMKHLSSIAGVEVVLMSNAGLRLHLNWWPAERAAAHPEAKSRRACQLACCAEHMI